MKHNLVVSHYNEDLQWTSSVEMNKYNIVLVSKTLENADIFQPKNTGYEASAFFEYIVKYYDTLPEYSVFVHGHETSWHHTGKMQDLVNNLQLGDKKYKNINLNQAIYEEMREIPDYWINTFRKLISCTDPSLAVPMYLKYIKCAQFYVHRDNIRMRDKETWQKMLETLTSGTNGHKYDAIVYEHCWCLIMTGYYNEEAWDSLNQI
jgi:hypothetical protein